jgi:hypothetical protein
MGIVQLAVVIVVLVMFTFSGSQFSVSPLEEHKIGSTMYGNRFLYSQAIQW